MAKTSNKVFRIRTSIFFSFLCGIIPTFSKLDLDLGPLMQLIIEFYEVFAYISDPVTNCTVIEDIKPLKLELNCGQKLLENGSETVVNDCSNPNIQLTTKLKLYLWHNTGQILKVIDITNAENITIGKARHSMSEWI